MPNYVDKIFLENIAAATARHATKKSGIQPWGQYAGILRVGFLPYI
jgi:hypothetical protein